MPSAAPQLNIRSRYARDRAAELARDIGRTATQVVEDALRAYSPPGPEETPPEILPSGLVRHGRLLVARSTGRTITLEETLAAIEQDRDERGS